MDYSRYCKQPLQTSDLHSIIWHVFWLSGLSMNGLQGKKRNIKTWKLTPSVCIKNGNNAPKTSVKLSYRIIWRETKTIFPLGHKSISCAANLFSKTKKKKSLDYRCFFVCVCVCVYS